MLLLPDHCRGGGLRLHKPLWYGYDDDDDEDESIHGMAVARFVIEDEHEEVEASDADDAHYDHHDPWWSWWWWLRQ